MEAKDEEIAVIYQTGRRAGIQESGGLNRWLVFWIGILLGGATVIGTFLVAHHYDIIIYEFGG